jgi:Rha family phage regulatory protein
MKSLMQHMAEEVVKIQTPQVSLHNNRTVTTSSNVAHVFRKNHKDVLRSIADLDCSERFARRNFAPCNYIDRNNRERWQYEMTRDGFVYLAFSFTGKKYAPFKEAYIEEFNRKEQALREIPSHVVALKGELSRQALAGNAEWRKIKRYKGMGLSHREIGKLLDMVGASVAKRVRAMEACGVLTPPANLALWQRCGQSNQRGGVA